MPRAKKKTMRTTWTIGIFRASFLPALFLVVATSNLPAGDYTCITNDGTLTVTGHTSSDGALDIPEAIDGLPVTQIGISVFRNCDRLTSVTIPASVTVIGGSAFTSCPKLTAITVDAKNPNYSSVDGVLFDKGRTQIMQCPEGKAGSYAVPETVTDIMGYAFCLCGDLTDISITDNVTSIGGFAFSSCKRLTAIKVGEKNPSYSSVDGVLFNKDRTVLIRYPEGKAGSYAIPGGVTKIVDYAFSDCVGLTSVLIPDSVTSIGDGAFSDCTILAKVTLSNRLGSIAEKAFSNCSGLTGVTIPDSVTNIGFSAFNFCTNIASVQIGTNVASIGKQAFSGCLNLARVKIPRRTTSVGNGAFYGCRSLASIEVDADNPAYSSVDGVLYNKSKSTLIQCKAGSVTIPDSVTSIGELAFHGCDSLTTVMIGKGLRSIGPETFCYCSGLIGVTIGESIASAMRRK